MFTTNPMQNLSLYSGAVSRSISAENPRGEKGKGAMSTDGPAMNAARELGQGWKVSPYVTIPQGETYTLAEIEGSGAIRHIWLTCAGLRPLMICRGWIPIVVATPSRSAMMLATRTAKFL